MAFRTSKLILAAALAAAVCAGTAGAKTLRVAPHSDLKIVDPIWTTALISVNHGYMVYDTLFALDGKLNPQPQMVERHEMSADKLTWTFTLRDGLEWHDGKPVTAEDCIASIKRWGARDTMGQKLLSYVADFSAPDAKTIRMVLKEPYGLVIQTLAKPGANVPFMMPKRVAETDPTKQITDYVGSGPFIFKQDEWRPGEKVVYLKNPKYKPRAEPASGLAGGKVAKVDRVEWIWIADAQTQVNALLKGEVDIIEAPPHDLLPLLAADKNVELFVWNPPGRQYAFRFNVLHKPFDNAKVRQAVAYALNQKDMLQSVIGDPEWFRECKSLFPCGSPLESTKGLRRQVRLQRRQGARAAAGGRLRRHAAGDHAVDRHRLAQQPRAGREIAARKGRLQGRRAGNGLADAGLAPHQEGPALRRRLARLPHLVGLGRRPRSGRGELPQRLL